MFKILSKPKKIINDIIKNSLKLPIYLNIEQYGK